MRYKYNEKLIYLPTMIKEMLFRTTAAVVCLWYLLCITGFDVHTCKISDKSFVVPAIEDNFSCRAIHPDQSCAPELEEDHCHGTSVPAAEVLTIPVFYPSACCSDEFQQFEASWARNLSSADDSAAVIGIHVLAQTAVMAELLLSPSFPVTFAGQTADLQSLLSEDLLSIYRVFRI